LVARIARLATGYRAAASENLVFAREIPRDFQVLLFVLAASVSLWDGRKARAERGMTLLKTALRGFFRAIVSLVRRASTSQKLALAFALF
jgi:hypothetical protein